MSRLTAFQTTLMVAIEANDDPSGQTIRRWLESNDVHAVEKVNHGRLYPNLDALIEKGYAEKGQQDCRTNYYTLTDAGRDRLEARHGFIGSVL